MTYPVRTGLAEIVDPPDLASSITICENEHLNERNAEKVRKNEDALLHPRDHRMVGAHEKNGECKNIAVITRFGPRLKISVSYLG